jgi:hypothetical protein
VLKSQHIGQWAKPCKCLGCPGLWRKGKEKHDHHCPLPPAALPTDHWYQREVSTIHSGELAAFSPGGYCVVQLSFQTLFAPLQKKAFGLINWVKSPALPGGGVRDSAHTSLYKERQYGWRLAKPDHSLWEIIIYSTTFKKHNSELKLKRAFGQTTWATALSLAQQSGRAGYCSQISSLWELLGEPTNPSKLNMTAPLRGACS